MSYKTISLHLYAKQFLLVIIFLLSIGIVFIYSASTILAVELYGSCHYFAKKHLIGLLLGFFGFMAARLIPVNLIELTAFYIWASSLTLTACTLFSSHAVLIHGSRRWLKYGNFVFQPSELLKIAFIIYLAAFFSRSKKPLLPLQYLPLVGVCLLTSCLLLAQPDFGLTVTLLMTTITLFFITYPHITHFIGIVLLLCASAATLIVTKAYRLQRILTFLDPWKDPKGKGFQIIQSFIAIGSGGWTGTGITQSKQKFFYLPMQHTDFIFSIIAEEIGFIGSLLLIGTFALLTYLGFRLALTMHNRFSQFCILGFTTLITLQASINIAVATGLVPTKGIGLPFISYGNTNTVCTLAMIGFLINLIHNDKRQTYKNA